MLEDEAVLGDTVEKDNQPGQEIVERHAEILIRTGSTGTILSKGLHLRSIFALALPCSGRRLCTDVWQVFVLQSSNEPRHVHSYTRTLFLPRAPFGLLFFLSWTSIAEYMYAALLILLLLFPLGI